MKWIVRVIGMGAAALFLTACGGDREAASSDERAAVTAPQPEGIGSVTGTIGGEEVDLYVLGSQSDHGNSHISLYVVGEDLRARGLGSLTLGAEWIGELDGSFTSADIAIRIPGTDPSRIYHASLDDGLSLIVTKSVLNGETLEIEGEIKGALTAMDLMGLRNPDPDPGNRLDIDLTFDAAIE